jgi:hypothetical protein
MGEKRYAYWGNNPHHLKRLEEAFKNSDVPNLIHIPIPLTQEGIESLFEQGELDKYDVLLIEGGFHVVAGKHIKPNYKKPIIMVDGGTWEAVHYGRLGKVNSNQEPKELRLSVIENILTYR